MLQMVRSHQAKMVETTEAVTSPLPSTPKKRKRAPPPPPQPAIVSDLAAAASPRIAKYWKQRHSLFSLYDRGIQMDEEGWFSVTPEPIAARHAARATAGTLVVDGFSGVGGNAIQFAARCCYVVAVEIDPRKIGFARNNAEIYGVEDNIDFVIGDFFQLGRRMMGDTVFLSPPWGGPSYRTIQNFTLGMLKPKDGYEIFQIAQRIAPNVIMFLPRNIDLDQVEELSWLSVPPLDFEIEENLVHGYVKGITAYFGDIAAGSSEDLNCV